MTGNLLLDSLISLAGIGVLIVLSTILRQKRDARVVTADQAAARLRLDEPDFEPGEWLLDANGRSALALSADGAEIALIRAHGDKLATRRLPAGQVKAALRTSGLELTLADPTWPDFSLSPPPGPLPRALQEWAR